MLTKSTGQNGNNYAQTKGANVLLAKEYQAEHQNDGECIRGQSNLARSRSTNRFLTPPGIISNSWNPGNLSSELQRHTPWVGQLMLKILLYPAIYGAYTELYAGWAEEAGKEEMKGEYYGPWGRKVRLREDLQKSAEQKRFWEWCEKETKDFA